MSIHIQFFESKSQIEHRAADGEVLKLGAIVRVGNAYKSDFERVRREITEGKTYRVVGLEGYPSSMRETMGIERERAANAAIAKGNERWYAAVLLRSIERDEEGAVIRLRQSPCETFICKPYQCTVPAEVLEIVEQGTGNTPKPDIDYSISPYEHLFPLYQAVDQAFEGYSNRPTACLALFLMNDRSSRLLLKRSLTKTGKLTAAKLKQLTRREGWLKHVDPDAHFTDPFPSFAPYRTEIDYEEIAQALTEPARNT